MSAFLLSTTCLAGALPGSSAYAADPVQAASNATVGEVVVTASRRAEAETKLPFSISAYGAKQLEKANITDVTALAQQVPNFIIQDNGARDAASSIPIIRGLNASEPSIGSARFFQSPVGMYLGDAPITGSLPLLDIDRVEVLRGPQGTLYGAGALAGAVRVAPTDPKLGVYGGFVSGSVEGIAHSHDIDNSVLGAINIPMGDTLAIRIATEREYDGGFIDQNDIMERAGGNFLSGAPLLANPGDVANSSAIYYNKKDVNYTRTYAARASALWQPTDRFRLVAAYNYARSNGDGGPVDDYTYTGGPSPIDPRITYAPTGDYQRSLSTLEPYHRESQLASVDASYDLGFATLSGTVAYGRTDAAAEFDATQNLLGTPYAFYYVGSPSNPRAVIPSTEEDNERRYTEEVRLISNEGKRFDYIVGAYFEQDNRHLGEEVYDPGADAQSAAANGGSTLPIVEGGTYIPLFANGQTYFQEAYQSFRDYSAFGDLTWHVTDKWQITAGTRVFHQTFNQVMDIAGSLFLVNISNTNSNTVTNHIFKANTSYEFVPNAQVYFTFSQGFRRGGANTFDLAGAALEPAALLTYKPDTANNYEVGVKGLVHGLYYAADLFYIDWTNAQIDLQTPYNLVSVVVNSNGVTSKGFEGELSGPLGINGFTFNLGLAYARARLANNFSLPAGSGIGTVIPNAITGEKGDRVPGAPDFSLSANVNYKLLLANQAPLTFSIGADYKSSTINVLPHISANTPATTSPGYALLHASIEYDLGNWELLLFGTNLTDSHVILSTTVRSLQSEQILGGWGASYVVARPREAGLRVTRRF